MDFRRRCQSPPRPMQRYHRHRARVRCGLIPGHNFFILSSVRNMQPACRLKSGDSCLKKAPAPVQPAEIRNPPIESQRVEYCGESTPPIRPGLLPDYGWPTLTSRGRRPQDANRAGRNEPRSVVSGPAWPPLRSHRAGATAGAAGRARFPPAPAGTIILETSSPRRRSPETAGLDGVRRDVCRGGARNKSRRPPPGRRGPVSHPTRPCCPRRSLCHAGH